MEYRKLPHGDEKLSTIGLGLGNIHLASNEEIEQTLNYAISQGMPPLFPTATAMVFELAAYGLVAELLYGHSRWQCVIALYRSLITAMLVGRIVWGTVQIVLLGLSGSAFTWQMFVSSAVLNSIPGIIVQLTLIPAIMVALNRTGLGKYQKMKPVENVGIQ